MNIGKKDVIWGYISLFLVQGINVILLPFILVFLSSKEVGLWYTFTSIYGLAMLIDFGFQATISRNISYIWSGAENIKSTGYQQAISEKGINKKYFITLLSSIKSIYYTMGIIILTLLLTVGTLYIYNVTLGEIDLKVVFISWFFYLTATILNIMFSFWNAILKGIGAIKDYNKTLVIAKISQVVFSLILLYLGFGIIGVTFAYLLSVLVNRVTLSRFFYRYNHLTMELKGKIKPIINKKIFKELLPNTFKTGITSFANYLVINFPIILASYYISLEVSGQFGIVNQIVTLCLTLSNSYFNTYLAKFNYYRVKNNIKDLIKLFKKSIIINYIINLTLFIGVILFANYFLDLISSGNSLLPIPLTILVIIYRFFYNNQTIFVSLLSTKNIVPYYKSFIVSSLITVGLQMFLLNINPTLLSLIIPVLIIQLLHNNWYWPMQVIKDLRR